MSRSILLARQGQRCASRPNGTSTLRAQSWPETGILISSTQPASISRFAILPIFFSKRDISYIHLTAISIRRIGAEYSWACHTIDQIVTVAHMVCGVGKFAAVIHAPELVNAGIGLSGR